MSQAQRDLVMQKFRQRHLQLLVATDVAARGLDVNDLTHVINYGLPDDTEVIRIGVAVQGVLEKREFPLQLSICGRRAV